MLPPVFYVQQLEQILLRKLLSPPTPANPARFAFCPRRRCALMSVFNFFVRFFRSVFRVKPYPFGLVCLRCAAAVFSCTPRPSFPPHLRLYPYSVFCSLFSCRATSIDLARLRCAPDALISIFSFLPALSISGRAPLAPRLSYSVFSFFRFSSTRISAGFMIFSYGENISNHL